MNPRLLLAALLALLASCATSNTPPLPDAHAQLLALHEETMQAHRESNAALIMRAEAPDYVVVNRGQLTQPTLDARQNLFQQYLSTTRFTEYADMIPPVVRVSNDNSLGWVIAQSARPECKPRSTAPRGLCRSNRHGSSSTSAATANGCA
jgi:hypothetical protein